MGWRVGALERGDRVERLVRVHDPLHAATVPPRARAAQVARRPLLDANRDPGPIPGPQRRSRCGREEKQHEAGGEARPMFTSCERQPCSASSEIRHAERPANDMSRRSEQRIFMPDCAVHEETLEGGPAISSYSDVHLKPLIISQLLQGATLPFWNKELLEVVGNLISPARSWALTLVLANTLDLTFEEQA